MRILPVSAAVALVAAGGVSAAVAAIPTGAAEPFVVERPTITKREADVTGLASIIASEAHRRACFNYLYTAGHWDTEHCGDPILNPPAINAAAITSTAPAINSEDTIPTGDAATASTAQSNMVKREADITGLALIAASLAHEMACISKFDEHGKWDSKDCGPWPSARRRDELGQPTTTLWTTIQSTSSIALTTTTIPIPWATNLMTYGRPIPTPPEVHMPPNFNVHPVSTLTTSTDSNGGVNVVQVTVTKTVRLGKPSTFDTSCTTTKPPPTWSPTTPCLSNTSVDTNSYLNISTWSMTGYNASTPGPASNSASPYYTEPSSLPLLTTKPTMTGTSGGAADISGFKGGVTSTLGSGVNHGNAIDLSSFHVPVGMVAAMGACFALALFL